MITKLYITAQQALIDFKKDQRGVTAIEYALIAAAVSAGIAATFNGTDGIGALVQNQMESIRLALGGTP